MGFEEQLQNIVAAITTSTLTNVGVAGQGAPAEAVPADHQRYVYFAKYWNRGGAVVLSIYESVAGVLALKEQQFLTQNQTQQFPSAGPSDVPVMRFRASGFIAVQASGTDLSGLGITLLILDKPGGA